MAMQHWLANGVYRLCKDQQSRAEDSIAGSGHVAGHVVALEDQLGGT